MEPTTDAHVVAAQIALDVADEQLEAAAGLIADALDRGLSEIEVQANLLAYRRALADRRYHAAVINAAMIDQAASA